MSEAFFTHLSNHKILEDRALNSEVSKGIGRSRRVGLLDLRCSLEDDNIFLHFQGETLTPEGTQAQGQCSAVVRSRAVLKLRVVGLSFVAFLSKVQASVCSKEGDDCSWSELACMPEQDASWRDRLTLGSGMRCAS